MLELFRAERFCEEVVSAQFRRHHAVEGAHARTGHDYDRNVERGPYQRQDFEAVNNRKIKVQDYKIGFERDEFRKSAHAVMGDFDCVITECLSYERASLRVVFDDEHVEVLRADFGIAQRFGMARLARDASTLRN